MIPFPDKDLGPVQPSADKGQGPRRELSPYAAYAVYGAAGVQLAASVVAGLLFGGYLDKKLGSSPWITIIGLALGFIGGLVNLVRITRVVSDDRGNRKAR